MCYQPTVQYCLCPYLENFDFLINLNVVNADYFVKWMSVSWSLPCKCTEAVHWVRERHTSVTALQVNDVDHPVTIDFWSFTCSGRDTLAISGTGFYGSDTFPNWQCESTERNWTLRLHVYPEKITSWCRTVGWHDRSWTILNGKLTMLELLNIY